MMTAMFVINVDHTDEDDPDKNCNAMYIYSGPKFSPPPLDNFGRPCSERCQKSACYFEILENFNYLWLISAWIDISSS